MGTSIAKRAELYCPSFLLQMNSIEISLLQKKSILGMSFFAATEREDEDGFISIGFRDFIKTVGVNPLSQAHFKNELTELLKRKLTVNLIGKEKEFIEKEAHIVLVKDFIVEQGKVSFKLSEYLMQAITGAKNEDGFKSKFAIINLDHLKDIRSKSALNLYLFICDYLGTYQTSKIKIDTLKKLLGTSSSKKERFTEFNRNKIQKGIDILKKFNINIKPEFSRFGKSIEAVSFKFYKGEDKEESKIEELPKNRTLLVQPDPKRLKNYIEKAIEDLSTSSKNIKNPEAYSGKLRARYNKGHEETIYNVNSKARELIAISSITKLVDYLTNLMNSLNQTKIFDRNEIKDEIQRAYITYCGGLENFAKNFYQYNDIKNIHRFLKDDEMKKLVSRIQL